MQRSISRWSFDGGIQVGGATRFRSDTIRAGIAQHDDRMTAAAIGILMEEICHELSWRLGASITRKQGDRYTLADLWPGVAKVLKKQGGEVAALVADIDARLEVRNLLGAHFNDFADAFVKDAAPGLPEVSSQFLRHRIKSVAAKRMAS